MLLKEYCYYCDTEREYEIKEDFIKTNIKGVEFEYMANIAYCKECGEEIYIAEIDDENIKRANKKYRKILGLIQISEIEEILRKYNIGKKPLSLLLGWGETTIIRYLNGLTPSKEYSEKLKEILINPYKMKEILEENKGVLSPVALKKLETRINTIICQSPTSSNCKESKLLNTAKFFLFKIDEEAGDVITPLKLQKLVYYAQAWFTAYFGKPLVTENCQAWIHGPVFPELYNYFKDKGYSPIPKVFNLDMSVFNDDEKYILETVWKVYGI
jgi:putative zinc finger/helix-turn-helix YgiT family protein